ncbi:SprT family zinc-dependent metalloprotease [Bacillus thuringiensis]|uniref:M48 family metallopeptidase n=1 Tax=Bacillus thuringiensis TaxID=1428 RepID=UPI0001A1F8D5|nr:SprT family zinc-dependent metalloprotease [Bacillus thuringiensis]EEN05015.1 Zinc metalloprotease [Bacillus thuringiensis IBL 4222]MED3017667.1 SprT family zinc-dependent metalloprotease [Bacillus thuringiensis]MED3040348.1 SprT family zinc-dependent metalloprotease [Bacillus thuringiensis]MED3369122.1 SprT family zinc-dependent metalloprotease [Bacillus thuringiensis]MED3461485.1 SprT family zinc-dependent metalloprotease [Bacillus thuringiensis]
MVHTYLGETINFHITYKKKKSVRLFVDSYGNVEVQAPKGTPVEYLVQLLEEKWDWIQTTRKEMAERAHGPQEKDYDQGEGFLYLGNTYPIQISQDASIEQDNAVFEGDKLHIYVKELKDEKIQQALKRFYYKQCKSLVEKSIKAHQSNFKTKPRSIRITDSSRTLGTCDSNLQLTFNWKLAMAPQRVIDYVVVHEMCHMVHLNHDRSFWRLVGKIMPDYKEMENWLALSSWKMTV